MESELFEVFMEREEILIIESFLKLLRKEPFDRLTPRTVTDSAGLPPSRFAYRFHDMYALADALLEEEMLTVENSDISPKSGGEAFLLSVSFLLREKDAARNLCLSSASGIYKKHVYKLAAKYFSDYLTERAAQKGGGADLAYSVRFLSAAAVGLASRELINSGDPAADARLYADLFDSAAEVF